MWLGPVLEGRDLPGDGGPVEQLIWEKHFGYAAAPSLSKEEAQRRLDEIAHIYDLVRRDRSALTPSSL